MATGERLQPSKELRKGGPTGKVGDNSPSASPVLTPKGFIYRVTNQVVTNLPLTAKQKIHYGLARPGKARPKQNFCFEVMGRFVTT